MYEHLFVHGHTSKTVNHRTPTYNAWRSIKMRCNCPSQRSFKYYGGRGIGYTPRWESFENFLADMGEKPDGMSIDRIDTNGHYCKENCRWASDTTQSRNRRNVKRYEMDGLNLTITEWSERSGIKYATMRHRLAILGWSVKQAINTPPWFKPDK